MDPVIRINLAADDRSVGVDNVDSPSIQGPISHGPPQLVWHSKDLNPCRGYFCRSVQNPISINQSLFLRPRFEVVHRLHKHQKTDIGRRMRTLVRSEGDRKKGDSIECALIRTIEIWGEM
jgi:hypothetical protein